MKTVHLAPWTFICLPFACPFHVCFLLGWSWVWKFRVIINFGLHCSLRVSLIFNFISIKGWVENLYINNYIKNLMAVMTNYFYRDNWIKGREMEVCRVSPKWIKKKKKMNKNHTWKPKIKFKNWYKIEIQTKSYFRFFNFYFSIFNVEFKFVSLLKCFSKCACFPTVLGNHFLILWTLFVTEFIYVPFWTNLVIFYYPKEHFLMILQQNPSASILSS